MQDKHNHHIIPQFYLKGFECLEKPSFVWVYEKGKDFMPGYIKSKYNPRQAPISKVGFERDYYAVPDRQGGTDFNKYEDILQTKETAADTLLRKIRNQQMISKAEKIIFAEYIVSFISRVPRFENHLESLWPDSIQIEKDRTIRHISRLKKKYQQIPHDDQEKLVKWQNKICIWEKVLEVSPKDLPREGSRMLMAKGNVNAVHIISQMTWQFLTAPQGDFFITNDNPVFFFEKLGIAGHPRSEVTFPISSDIALVASLNRELPEKIFSAKSQELKEINRRSARSAMKQVYCSKSESWVANILNKKNYQVNFLYRER